MRFNPDDMGGRPPRESRLVKARDDRLTPEDRDLIARFEAAKGVTVVPMGVRAIDCTVPRSFNARKTEGLRKSARDRKFQRLKQAESALEAAMAPVPAGPRPPRQEPVRKPAAGAPALDRLPALRAGAKQPAHLTAWSSQCRFAEVPVAQLRIRRGAYQRAMGRNSARRVKRLAEQFDWAKFGTLTLRAAAGGGFEIVDGQHRAAAARARGFRTVPAVIVEGAGATVFLGLNRDRSALDSAQLYHAELLAGEAEAAALGAILDRLAIAVPRTQSTRGYAPMQTRAIVALRLELRARGPGLLETALTVMARAWARQDNAFTAETVRGIALALAEIRAAPDLARPVADECAALADTLAALPPTDLRASSRSAAAKHGGPAHRHLARLVCNAHAARGGAVVAVEV